MSPRVTRSATKLAADSSFAAATTANTSTVPQSLAKSRKRKTPPDRDPSPDDTPVPTKSPPAKRAKKQKLSSERTSTTTAPRAGRKGTKQAANMAKPG